MSARVAARSWAVLAESDSDSDSDTDKSPVAVAAVSKKSVTWTDPEPEPVPCRTGFHGDMNLVLEEMSSGRKTWGDIMAEFLPADIGLPPPTVSDVPARANTWDDFYALPFTAGLREVWGDLYDCSSLTDAEWNELMRWLFDAGWDVTSYDRNSVEFEPDNGPRRSWIPPEELEAMLAEEAAMRRRSHHHSHSHSHSHSHAASAGKKPAAEAEAAPKPAAAGRKKGGATVPRFCRAAVTCTEEGCRYVHGDTIPRVDKPCGFGAACGASDPSGLKRSQCLYMHPGETWTEGLVVRRPPVAAATTE
jgi:hypothetical protein